jgi:hypothetical protein
VDYNGVPRFADGCNSGGAIVKTLPSLSQVMADPSVHFRVKEWLREGLSADPVDAYYDALLVAELLKQRMEQDLRGGAR